MNMTRNRNDIEEDSKRVRNRLRALQSIGAATTLNKMNDNDRTSSTVQQPSAGQVVEADSKTGNSIFDRVIKVITRPPEEREAADDFRLLVSWLKQKVLTFRALSPDVVGVILTECTFETANVDDVIIRQGNLGDCCYVLLRGSVTVYINAVLSEEEDAAKVTEMANRTLSSSDNEQLDRSKFGASIDVMEVGRSFGEMALLSSTCIRQATIIANERCDLLVVNRDLYNRSLHYTQAADFAARMRFVENHPLFQRWPQHHRRQMAMSIQRRKVEFEHPIVRQGDAVEALYLVNRGQGKVTVDPLQHLVQYPHLRHLLVPSNSSHFGVGDGGDMSNMADDMTINSPRRHAWHSTDIENFPLSTRSLVDRGHVTNDVEMTTRLLESHRRKPARRVTGHCRRLIEVSLVGTNDIIGDIEFALGLRTHVQSVICTEQCDVFFLNARNYERLIIKRHPTTAESIIRCVQLKLSARISRLHFDQVPLFRDLLAKINAVDNDGHLSDGPGHGPGHSRLHGLRDETANSRRPLQHQQQQALDSGFFDRRNQPPQSSQLFRSKSFRQTDLAARQNGAVTAISTASRSVTVLCSSLNGWRARGPSGVGDSDRLPTLAHHGRSQTDIAVGNSHRHHPYQSPDITDRLTEPVLEVSTDNERGSFFSTSVNKYEDNMQDDGTPSEVNRILNGRVVSMAPTVYASCSDEVLSGLETRIKSWHNKVVTSPACIRPLATQGQTRAVVPQLKRVSIQGREPLQGNHVLLRRKRQQQSGSSASSSVGLRGASSVSMDEKRCAKEIVRMLLDGKKFATNTDLFDETLYM